MKTAQTILARNPQRTGLQYSRTPASADPVSAVSVIRGLPPENIKWKIPEINDS
jgi:hypothetical protein